LLAVAAVAVVVITVLVLAVAAEDFAQQLQLRAAQVVLKLH
jgi:hypothetical protein